MSRLSWLAVLFVDSYAWPRPRRRATRWRYFKVIAWPRQAALVFSLVKLLCIAVYFAVRNHSNEIQAVHVQVVTQNGELANIARRRKSSLGTFYVCIVFLVRLLPGYCIFVASTILVGLKLHSHRWTVWNVKPKFFNFVVCNPCQSSPSVTILVPFWFIITFLVFFYLCKVLFSGFLPFNGDFVDSQNKSKYRDFERLNRARGGWCF